MAVIKSGIAGFAITILLGAAAQAQQRPAPQTPPLQNQATQNATGQVSPPAVQIDADDIGGTVTSRFGPEAGVWVIAETRDLGTRFAKIAVTDERGRYV
ncbi:MAG: hypothetical protein JO008_17105, partial [Alphaproteobacteria bacterium]|nr:hypothetical protein [Alphaproteobacteria bacterium]